MAMFHVLYYSSFYQFGRFLRSLSHSYTGMLCASWVWDRREMNPKEQGYRYVRLFWGRKTY